VFKTHVGDVTTGELQMLQGIFQPFHHCQHSLVINICTVVDTHTSNVITSRWT